MTAVRMRPIATTLYVASWKPVSPSRSLSRLVPAMAALALIGVLATGCGGSESGATSQATGQAPAPQAIAERGAIGATQQGDGIAASIDAVRIGEARDMVDIDPETDEIDTASLASGQEFLILEVTIENVGTTPHEYNAVSWSATDPKTGAKYETALMAMTGRDLAAGDLEAGEESHGEVVLTIPAAATTLSVSYDTQLFGQGTRLTWNVDVPR